MGRAARTFLVRRHQGKVAFPAVPHPALPSPTTAPSPASPALPAQPTRLPFPSHSPLCSPAAGVPGWRVRVPCVSPLG